MIPKLEFTAESWQEEYREQATETLERISIKNLLLMVVKIFCVAL